MRGGGWRSLLGHCSDLGQGWWQSTTPRHSPRCAPRSTPGRGPPGAAAGPGSSGVGPGDTDSAHGPRAERVVGSASAVSGFYLSGTAARPSRPPAGRPAMRRDPQAAAARKISKVNWQLESCLQLDQPTRRDDVRKCRGCRNKIACQSSCPVTSESVRIRAESRP